MDLRLVDKERNLLAALLEAHHCDLLQQTFRAHEAEQHDAKRAVLEQRKVLEAIMDKMGLLVRSRAS